MSNDTITVNLKEREILGKGLARIRSDGQIPAVIHDHGKPSIHVMGDYSMLSKVVKQAGGHAPVQVKIGNKQRLALIKDVDVEPTKRTMRHVVFQAIRQNEKTTAEIPIVLKGDEIPAEKNGYMVLKQLDNVEVEALPMNLPNELEVDATQLSEVGDKLTVADIKVSSDVTILAEPEQQIVVVEEPRDQVAEADAALEESAEMPEAEHGGEDEGEEPAEEGGEAETAPSEENKE